MAITHLSFTKDWTDSSDFATYEGNEAQVREDMQYLFDEVKNYINNTLIPGITQEVQSISLNINTTSAELNELHEAGAVKADFSKLHDVTSTAAELNTLDGITATTAELNTLDGITATTEELNKLDGYTGTAEDLNTAVSSTHTHSNKALLDTYDQTNTNITDAVSKKHEHSNKAVLDTITYSQSNLFVEALKLAHPVNTGIVITATNTNPSTFMGFGTWELISQGRALVGAGTGTDKNSVTHTFGAGADEDGEYEHTLGVTEMPSHKHTSFASSEGNVPDYFAGSENDYGITGGDGGGSYRRYTSSVGGGLSHNNIQPSYGVYVWLRTA